MVPILTWWIGSWRISLGRRPFTNGELRIAYDNDAPAWTERIDRMGTTAFYYGIWKELADELAAYPGDGAVSALDCGIGDGAFSAACVHSTWRPMDLHGIDLSPRMLEAASGRLTAAGIDPKLWVGDAGNLPFEDNTFDLVMSAHMLEHSANLGSALLEMHRVLRPGGLLVLAISRRALAALPIQIKWRTQALTPDEVEAIFRIAGLDRARILKAAGRGLADQLSIVCVGYKSGSLHDTTPGRIGDEGD